MKKVTWALLVGVVLVGIGWALDSNARSSTAERIADGVSDTIGGAADVRLAGFPFLTQLAAGELEGVEIEVPALTLDGMRMEDARVRASGVSTADPHTIRSLTASVTVPIGEVNRLVTEVSGLSAGIEIRGDALAIAGEVLGQELVVVFRPEAVDEGLSLAPDELILGERSLEIALIDRLFGGLAEEVVLPVDLPPGLRITAIEVLPAGVQLRVEGTDFTPDEAVFPQGDAAVVR